MGEQVVPESWLIPRALSSEALRLLTSLPVDEIERRLRMDGPAVPEDREPAAIEGQPSDEKLLCIAAETICGYGDAGIKPGEYESFTESVVEAYGSELCAFARAVLDRWGSQTVLVPAEGEVAELVAALRMDAECFAAEQPDLMQLTDKQLTRAAFLLEQLSASHPLRPIPVSERLPGPEDCQPWPGWPGGSHWCWVFVKGSLGVDSWERRPATCLAGYRPMHTHWLPANALPLPEAQP